MIVPSISFQAVCARAAGGISLAALRLRRPRPVRGQEEAPMPGQDRFLPIVLLSLALATGASAQDKAAKAQDKAPPKREAEVKNPYLERFRQLDRNGDGYVTLEEWPLEPDSFQVVDRNQDGRLSRNELLTPNVLRRDPRDEPRLGTDENGLPDYGNAFRNNQDTWNSRATSRDRARFRSLDRNQDNRLSLLEWTGSNLTFDRLDRNRDGVLSPNEWPK
jgi:EF hand domain-containing protein